jgi:uncharacterized protein YdaU (DUF1376 family)
MHYYPFNLKDYLVETAHLPPMADLAYRRLLDLYYKNEEPIPNKPKWVANRIRLDSEEAVIGFVLREFFTLDGVGTTAVWRQDRVDREIAKYQKKVAVARENGAQHLPGTNRQPKSDADRSLTKNHQPRRNTPQPPEGVMVVFNEFWELHPRKVGRPKALQAFSAATVRGSKPEDILAGLKRHLPVWAAKKAAGDGDKIPHPTTWLNRDGWTDEVMPDGAAQGRLQVAATAARHTDSAEDTARMLAERNVGTRGMPPELRGVVAQLTGRKAA